MRSQALRESESVSLPTHTHNDNDIMELVGSSNSNDVWLCYSVLLGTGDSYGTNVPHTRSQSMMYCPKLTLTLR